MAAILHLVRHAAHDRIGDVLCGRMAGVTLGTEGRRQAVSLGDRLAGEAIEAVYSSPLERARETAEPIAARTGTDVLVAEALNEIDFGAWTGRRFDSLTGDVSWQNWNRERSKASPPGGEAFAAVQARMVAFLLQLARRHDGRGAVAVSHCDPIRAALCAFLNCRSLNDYDRFEISPASVTRIVFWGEGWKVLSMNEPAAQRSLATAAAA